MRLYLVRNGVPYDLAFAWPDDFALAAYVIMGRFEGGEWDWDAMQWRPPKEL